MPQSYRHQKKIDSLNIYPAFTDLMSNAFMILSLFLLLALFQATDLNRKLQSASPIVIDEKSGNFKFPSGSAELTLPLKLYITKQVIPAIEQVVKEKQGAIEFVQVIGHTDGQENNMASNLDQRLETVAAGQATVKVLTPGSNTDLGLMRALAVIQEIRKTGRFRKIEFKAYSAGQLYDASGNLASINRKPDESRRRIEIRFIPPGKKQ
ncbi:flagellar motor protein [Synechocystis sp. LKSZ1]|uniref:flagellar motor protein n=1 Tax=Synechocystis sp. LKSZ1 TaxID=3144951 RepID=UPI00336BBD3C